MASESSFDIVSEFDIQELRNAVDQTIKECITRYDLKDSKIVIELKDDQIDINVANEYQVESVKGILLQKIINRKLSPKILDFQDFEPAANMRVRQTIKLIKAMDQETAKEISRFIRDNFPKAKPNIQGPVVRVSSKDKDELQAIIQMLKSKEDLKIPIEFTNFR